MQCTQPSILSGMRNNYMYQHQTPTVTDRVASEAI